MRLYDRITEYANGSFGEDMWCYSCKEVRAVCPDCGTTICVFCDIDCAGCGESIF